MSVFLRNAVRNGRNLKVTIATQGEGYKRAVDAIGQQFKDEAGRIVAERIEAGVAFKDADLSKMDEIVIKNMNHSSPDDENAHYSVEGWGANGKIKDVHITEDPSKQTQAK